MKYFPVQQPPSTHHQGTGKKGEGDPNLLARPSMLQTLCSSSREHGPHLPMQLEWIKAKKKKKKKKEKKRKRKKKKRKEIVKIAFFPTKIT